MVATRFPIVNSESPVCGRIAKRYPPGMTVRENRRANLQRLLQEVDGNKSRAARIANVSDKYLQQIVRGFQGPKDRTPRQVGDRLARQLERGFGKPVGWMDRPHDADQEAVETVARGSTDITRMDDLGGQAQSMSLRPGEMLIPQHEGVHPRMGSADMSDDEVITYIRVSEDGLRRTLAGTPVTQLSALRLVTARGYSMQPTFRHGDPLLVDTGVHRVELDGVYVLRGPEGAQVKRVQRRRDGLLLISDNKTYEPELVAREETATYQVLGRVVYVWSGSAL